MSTPASAAQRQQYWQRVERLTIRCLLAWFGVTFLTIFYARELATVIVFGWPLSFYMAAQGLTLVYVLICAVYALAMRKSDRRYRDGLHDDE